MSIKVGDKVKVVIDRENSQISLHLNGEDIHFKIYDSCLSRYKLYPAVWIYSPNTEIDIIEKI